MKTQKIAEVKSKNEANPKTAIIYCRAATKEEAKRQQAEAEKRAKELNAVVKAVFIDINPMSKPIVRRRFVRFFIKNQRLKADRQKEWRKATAYLKEHKTDYAITRSPDRISRNTLEFYKIEGNIKRLGTRLVYYTIKLEDMDTFEEFEDSIAKELAAVIKADLA